MSKRKDRRRVEGLFRSVIEIASRNDGASGGEHGAPAHADGPIPDAALAASRHLSRVLRPEGASRTGGLTLMKKFRFQLLHRWIVEHVEPCRVADVGGGKGLLAYLLQQSGWPATVIDPHPQSLPDKYKDLASERQCRLENARVPRLDQAFAPDMARDFDLLVAMHAHGCNLQLIDAAAEFGCSFLVLPCCIIHEPLRPPPGIHWLECVADYAAGKGFAVEPFRLNFKGQNIGLYAPARVQPGRAPVFWER